MERIKRMEDRFGPVGGPEITPNMIREALEVLEARGLVYYTAEGAYVPTEGGWKLLQETKPLKEEINAFGHVNITASHKVTLEITKASEIRKDADCIIAVGANKACADLSRDMKDSLKEAKKVEITISADEIEDKVIGFGSPALKLTHPEDIVIRKSDYIDNRTLVILANKAASDLKKHLVEKLKNPKTQVKIILEIKA